MRTTLNIDDVLMRAARREATERGVTLTEVIEDALRDRLTQRDERPQFRLRFPTVRGWGPPRVDINDRRALYDAMEESDRDA